MATGRHQVTVYIAKPLSCPLTQAQNCPCGRAAYPVWLKP